MSELSNVTGTPGDWIFVVPIGNLQLTDSVNNEFRINGVTFIHKEKLRRVRKRFGINKRISELREFHPHDRFFDTADTFAVVRRRGKPAELKTRCFRMVKDELSILAASQLGYAKRRFTKQVSLFGEHERGTAQHLFLTKDGPLMSQAWEVIGSPGALVLDSTWKHFQKKVFFFRLLKIIRKEVKVARNWRNDLTNAAILIGQSLNSNDVAFSFLWNMIAIELILTRQGDKYSDILPRRIEAFLGWVGGFSQQRIEDAYRKRSAFVHDGNRENITKEDLLFTDDLLLNLITNLVSYPRLFGSKDRVIDFSDKVEAEQKLGLKSKVRPKGLRFFSRLYTKEDYDEI